MTYDPNSPRQADPRLARLAERPGILSQLKGEPLSLGLLAICLCLLGLFFYVLREVPKGRAEIIELTKYVMSNCIARPNVP
jgi:hypothetical protein